jgi:prolyl oligopeptidase
MFTSLILAATLTSAPSPGDADPFQWLEKPRDPKALEWVRAQTKAAETELDAKPNYAELEQQLKTILAAQDPPPQISLLGPIAVRFQRSATHPHGVLEYARRAANGVPGAWHLSLDVDALRKTEGKAFELHAGSERSTCLAPEFTRCILSLSPAGADDVELREFDLVRAQFVKEGFHTPAGRNTAVWLNPDTLLIQHSLNHDPRTGAGWPTVTYMWKRGTPLENARPVAKGAATDAIELLSSIGSGSYRLGLVVRALDYSTFSMQTIAQDGTLSPVELPQKLAMTFPPPTTERNIVAQVVETVTLAGKEIPKDSIVAYDVTPGLPAATRLKIIYTPKADEFLTNAVFGGFAAARSSVDFILTRGGVQRRVTFTKEDADWKETKGESAPAGQSMNLASADPASDDLIVSTSGFTTPTHLTLHRAGSPSTTLYAQKPVFDAKDFRVQLKSARSKDGTDVDYFLLSPKTPARPGQTPTLMTGYGAFGLSFQPGYLDTTVGGPSLALWLQHGGALALPLIRGGGDRGEAWHQAAIRDKRQNSYDDFAAVAETLIKDGLTSPKHLGVFGQSNGGLLSAVMGTQRPDLFAAVVSDVPLTDMLRFPLMGMGGAWTNEYGDPLKPAAAEYLRRYSPYQNAGPGKHYPKFLITVSTADNRVGPGHARKLAAKLEQSGAKVYFLEDEEGGHGVSDPLSRPRLMAERMTFLIDTLQ